MKKDERTQFIVRVDKKTLELMEKARGRTRPRLEYRNTFVQIAIRERSERILGKNE